MIGSKKVSCPSKRGNLGGAIVGECSTAKTLWNEGSGRGRRKDCQSTVEALGSHGMRVSEISKRSVRHVKADK